MNNSNLIEVEKNLFNNLHSDFSKLFNTLHKYDLNIDTNILMKLLELNNNINKLQLDINSIKIDLLKKSSNSLNEFEKNIIIDNDNDSKVLELFKPYMLYYRMLLDTS
jgi:hypothetical protein